MSHRASHWAVEQKVGDPTAKLLLLTLAEGADIDTGETWPSQATLARRIEASQKTVARKLGLLEKLGLVTVSNRTRPDGGRTSNVYTLRLDATPPVNLTGGRGTELCPIPLDRAVSTPPGQSCVPPIRKVSRKVSGKVSSGAVAPEQQEAGNAPRIEAPLEATANPSSEANPTGETFLSAEIRLGGPEAASEAPTSVEAASCEQSARTAPERAKAARSRKESDPADGKRAADIIAVWCEEYRDTYGETYRVSGKDAAAARRIGRAMTPDEFRPYIGQVWSAPSTAFNCRRRSSTLSDLDSAWMAIRHELRGLGRLGAETPAVGGVFQIGGAK